jgi:hypothetical protein
MFCSVEYLDFAKFHTRSFKIVMRGIKMISLISLSKSTTPLKEQLYINCIEIEMIVLYLHEENKDTFTFLFTSCRFEIMNL